MPLILIGLGVLLVIYLQNYCYRRLWDKGLDFRVLYSQKEAFEGDEVVIRIELTNKKILPLPWVHITAEMMKMFQLSEFELDEKYGFLQNAGMFTSIMMFSKLRNRIFYVCNKRGVFRLQRAKVNVCNLLHTEEFYKEIKLDSELLVFPKTLDNFKEVDLLYKIVDSIVQSKALINPDPFEFKGIRDYQPTDTLKSINFKATAISQKLMVNIHAPTTAYKLTLLLNTDFSQNYSIEELYEQSIRLAATLAKHYIELGASLSFVTNGRDISSGEPLLVRGGTSGMHMYSIYEALARIDLHIRPKPMCEYVDTITDKEQVFLFISPYYSDEFMDSFHRLKQRQVSAQMIIPYIKRPAVRLGSNVVIWDATPV